MSTYPKSNLVSINIESLEAGLNTSKDQSLTSFAYAQSVENFDFSSGALKNGYGFDDLMKKIANSEEELAILKQDLDSIGGIDKVFYFYKYDQETNSREDKLVIVSDVFKLYYIDLFASTKALKQIRGDFFTSSPNAVRYRLNGEDVLILTSETDSMVVFNGEDTPYAVLDAPKISSMALHYERLFATVDGEKNAVWFSDDLDPTNWSLSLDEAGFIELIDERGALLKVVSFCDYVYIFREYGISRLSAYGDQSSFAVSNLFVSSGKIYGNTVCVCGDRIIFLAEDGLYSFDGVNTTRILNNITENISYLDNQKASACYYNGLYFIALKFRFLHHEDECFSSVYPNAMIVVDLNKNKLVNVTHGVFIKYLCSIPEKIDGVIAIAVDNKKNAFRACIIDKNASYFGKQLEKVWISPKTKLGDNYTKSVLRTIEVCTSDNITLTIFFDGEQRKIEFTSSTKPSIKRVNIPLRTFSFKINSTSKECNIHNLCFRFNKSKTYF